MKNFIWQRHVANVSVSIAFVFYILFKVTGTGCEIFAAIAMPAMFISLIFIIITEVKEAKNKPFRPLKTVLSYIAGFMLLSVIGLTLSNKPYLGTIFWSLYFLGFVLSNVQVILAEKKKREHEKN